MGLWSFQTLVPPKVGTTCASHGFVCMTFRGTPGWITRSGFPTCFPMTRLIIRFLAPLLLIFSNVAAESLSAPVKNAVSVMDRLYWSETIGIWLDRPGDDLRGVVEGRINPPWWSAANAVETLVDYMDATGSSDHDEALAKLHRINREPVSRIPLALKELKKRGQGREGDEKLAAKRRGNPANTDFRNEYLDDSGWWGVAWLRVYERTKDPRYLATAKAIHAHMAARWKPEGGGVIWCVEPGKGKTNSITNSLFLVLSARLARLDPSAGTRAWAERSRAWLLEKKVFDGTGVLDGPETKGDYWSYNQGAYLAGLAAYAEMTGKAEDAEAVAVVAEAIMTKGGFVAEDGVLKERLGTSGWDGCLFKGIMARNLRQVLDFLSARKLHPETVAKLDDCLWKTALVIMSKGAGADGQFPAEWHDGAKNLERNYNTHLSALTALVAALPVKR